MVDTLMCKEHWWNETGREELKYSAKNLYQCQIVYHKSHADWPRMKWSFRWKTGD
jgi:hypothetical protein